MRQAPMSERFFIKQYVCKRTMCPSRISQNGCIMKVAGIKKPIKNQAPIRALYPKRILSAPNKPTTPKRGISTAAIGIPTRAA